VIYLDSTIVLADLFSERRSEPDSFWRNQFVSSRLLEYEVWNRIHARNIVKAKAERAKSLLARVDLIEMTPAALERATKPFSVFLRTLDALHVATLTYVHALNAQVQLASYDKRMVTAAESLDIPLYEF
jgi:uncharacterized protein